LAYDITIEYTIPTAKDDDDDDDVMHGSLTAVFYLNCAFVIVFQFSSPNLDDSLSAV